MKNKTTPHQCEAGHSPVNRTPAVVMARQPIVSRTSSALRMELPEWMRERARAEVWGESPPPNAPSDGMRRLSWGRRLLRKTLGGFARLLEDLAGNHAVASRMGLLQRLDPRAKVLAAAVLLLVAACAHRTAVLAFMLLVGVGLAMASRIPTRMLLRVWLAAPLFSALIILPAVLNIVTPGQPVLTLWQTSSGWMLTVTDPGLHVAGRFLLRLLVCVTLALLLTATTPPARLFRGLRALGVPVLFVMLLSMMERYLSLLVRMAEEMHLARLSRSITFGSAFREQAWVATGMGELFRRTYRLSDKIYLAMISRGYTGETRLLKEQRWRRGDWLALGLTVVLAVGLGIGDRFL